MLPIIDPHPVVVLASASPRRSELLRQLAIAHVIHAVDIDETPRREEDPVDYVQRMALEKAGACWTALSRSPVMPRVLAADTSVILKGRILGKPRDREDAMAMLASLAGSTHEVLTAVCLRTAADEEARTVLSRSLVTMAPLSHQQILDYWETGEPCDKAGGYAVQGRAAMFITRIEGSYSGIMGLPLHETATLLGLLSA